MPLRDFLYLDRALVRSFLAQAEGGLVDEETERKTTAGKRGFGGKVGAGPAAVSGEKSKTTSVESEAIVRQVAASEFDRLYEYLQADGLEIIEDLSDEAVVGRLKRKQFLEVDARVRLSGLHSAAKLFGTIGALAPLIEQFSPQSQLEPQTLEQFQTLSAVLDTGKTIPVIATVSGPTHFKIGLELDPTYSQTENWDVEASVLLKVQRVLRGDDTYIVGDPFGGLLSLLPNANTDELFKNLRTSEFAAVGGAVEIEIKAPAVVGTAVAIYR